MSKLINFLKKSRVLEAALNVSPEHSFDLWVVDATQVIASQRRGTALILGHTLELPDLTVENHVLWVPVSTVSPSTPDENGLALWEAKGTYVLPKNKSLGALIDVGWAPPSHASNRSVPHWLAAGVFFEGRVLPEKPFWTQALRMEAVSDPSHLIFPNQPGDLRGNATHANNFRVGSWLFGLENRLNLDLNRVNAQGPNYGLNYRFMFTVAALLGK